MAGESQKTTDHTTIKQWVESRDGHPAAVKSTESKDDPGLLRIYFPGYGEEEALDEISWEQFFEKFEGSNLAFVYQEDLKSGEESRFCKLVSR